MRKLKRESPYSFVGYYLGRLVPAGTVWGGLVVLAGAMAACAVLGMTIERLAFLHVPEPTGDVPFASVSVGKRRSQTHVQNGCYPAGRGRPWCLSSMSVITARMKSSASLVMPPSMPP